MVRHMMFFVAFPSEIVITVRWTAGERPETAGNKQPWKSVGE